MSLRGFVSANLRIVVSRSALAEGSFGRLVYQSSRAGSFHRYSNPTLLVERFACGDFKSSSILSKNRFLDRQQTRGYLYLPLSWADLKERIQRWVEKAEKRMVRVRLLNRAAIEESSTLTFQRLRRKTWKRPSARARKRRPWARYLRNQQRKVTHPQSASNLLLKLPSAQPSKERSNSVSSGVQGIRNKYQGWKSLRKEQYLGWKNRRRDQYQGWKLRQREQYRDWKVRRKEAWKDTRKKAWERTRKILLEEYSKPEWFDSSGRPLTSRDSTGRFVNPWQSQSTNGIHSVGTILRWRWQRLEREIHQIFGTQTAMSAPKSVSPLLTQTIPPLPSPSKSSLQFTWIGHSTGLFHVQQQFTILMDPMFSVRASPFQNSPIGIARDVAPAFSIAELVEHENKHRAAAISQHSQKIQFGALDICCITHDHYDHMDENSVKELEEHVQLWVVPLGIAEWLVKKCRIDKKRIVELAWWEERRVIKRDGRIVVLDSNDTVCPKDKCSGKISDVGEVMTVTCCPASHWGSRTMWDRNFRLWCSFAFSTSNVSFFYCGDTGYPETFPLFHQIGDALGPFNFCAIPIAAYEPEEMMKDAHVNPSEAVRIHNDLQSQKSVGIHWGSFQLSEEPIDAPPRDLYHAIELKKDDGNKPIDFSVLQHGETVEVF